jgi:hypothetical protein
MISYRRHCVRTIVNLILTVPKWMICRYHTNPSHKVPLNFVWLKFSSFWWDIDMRRIRSGKTLSLGMPKAPQGNIQGIPKQLSLGMPRKASPLSSSTLSITLLGAIFLFVTWYVFCLEHYFIFFDICLLLLIIMLVSFISIKVTSIAFTMLNLQVYMLLFENRKFAVMSWIFLNSQNMIKSWNFSQ